MPPSTIGGINLLPTQKSGRSTHATSLFKFSWKNIIFPRSHPHPAITLLQFRFATGSTDVEMRLYPQSRFSRPDPVCSSDRYLNGQIHVLLYILNDPDSPRYNVDKMPDGSPTRFGTLKRNLEAESQACEAGLAPGQVRRGLENVRSSH
jgi:hypothetical protein